MRDEASPKALLAFSADVFEYSLSLQVVGQPFVDVLVDVRLELGSRGSLRQRFQDDAQTVLGYARREGKDRSIKLIGFLDERSIFQLQPLIGNRQGFLFIRDELVEALAVCLQEALDHFTVLFQEGAPGGNDIDREGCRFEVAQVGEDVHPHTCGLAGIRGSEESCVKGPLEK